MDELLDEAARPEMAARIQQAFLDYRESLSADRRSLLDQFRPVELARKVVGVGSVGTRAWVMLMIGRDTADPLFMQIKEAQPSVLERFLPPSKYDNCGHRVVAGQRTMQANSDILLGWNRMTGLDGVEHDFYVRQLHDWKGSADIEQLSPEGAGGLRRPVRVDAGPRPRAIGGPGRDRGLPRLGHGVRPGHRRLRRRLRRAQRAGLQGTANSNRGRAATHPRSVSQHPPAVHPRACNVCQSAACGKLWS